MSDATVVSTTALQMEMLQCWNQRVPATLPPPDKVRLWHAGGCGLWLDNEWGPAVPYPSVKHADGAENHGYVRLKDNLNRVDAIAELQGMPEYEKFIRQINAPESPIESVGCEWHLFEDNEQKIARHYMGSYTDVVFSNAHLNDDPINIVKLSAHLISPVQECEKWWANISMVIQKFFAVPGASDPWGLMVHITNHGRDKEEARRGWAASLDRLGTAIEALTTNFPPQNL